MSETTDGVRLQKVLAAAGVASRRASEILIDEGRVEVNGISWTARSSDGANFRKGELVTVERIEGVKLIVKAQN